VLGSKREKEQEFVGGTERILLEPSLEPMEGRGVKGSFTNPEPEGWVGGAVPFARHTRREVGFPQKTDEEKVWGYGNIIGRALKNWNREPRT